MVLSVDERSRRAGRGVPDCLGEVGVAERVGAAGVDQVDAVAG